MRVSLYARGKPPESAARNVRDSVAGSPRRMETPGERRKPSFRAASRCLVLLHRFSARLLLYPFGTRPVDRIWTKTRLTFSYSLAE